MTECLCQFKGNLCQRFSATTHIWSADHTVTRRPRSLSDLFSDCPCVCSKRSLFVFVSIKVLPLKSFQVGMKKKKKQL